MSITRNNIKITVVSKYLKKWEDYMPDDITRADVRAWNKAHLEVTMGGLMPIPIDCTYAGCYLESKIRKEKLLPKDEVDDLLFYLGTKSFMDGKHTWERAMKKYNELKELKGLK